jgi:hypothetical protein
MSIAANSTVDLVLELPSGSIRGITVDREGRPVGRVRLNLHSQGASSDAPVFGMGGSTQSDAQGRFEFVHVAPGTYSITADDRPGSLVRQGRTTQGGFVVRDGAGLDGVKFVLLPGCRVECSVRRPDGQPGAGVRIVVREESGEMWPDSWSTDAVGKVVIDGLPPGRYSFQARAGQCASQETEAIALGDSAPTKLDFALQEATDLYVSSLDAAGNPAWVWVEVFDARGRTANRSWGSGDSGVKPRGLHFGPLPPGTYTLRTQKDGGTLEQQVKLSGEHTLSLTLHPPN